MGYAVACGGQPSRSPRHVEEERESVSLPAQARQPEPDLPSVEPPWAEVTASPSWVIGVVPEPPGCSGYERPLMQVAAEVAARQLHGATALEPSDIVARLRALGSPHVWPRVWTFESSAAESAGWEGAWGLWLSSLPAAPERRCGVAVAGLSGARRVFAVVVTEPLADLAPVPSRARLGQWVRLQAHVTDEGVSGARVVLLGPRGLPRAVPTSLRVGAIRSSFSLDQAGMWRVQVTLETSRGPRPALEAWIFVDEPPSSLALAASVPGERGTGVGEGSVDGLRAGMLQMINDARASEQLPPLGRDARLDVLAQEHALAVLDAGQASHDTGRGSPLERLERAEYRALRVGENVATARSLLHAHRALWNSPAHRSNILDPRFDLVGIGIAPEPPHAASDTGAPSAAPASKGARAPQVPVTRGRFWVCQIFADSAPVETHGVTGIGL